MLLKTVESYLKKNNFKYNSISFDDWNKIYCLAYSNSSQDTVELYVPSELVTNANPKKLMDKSVRAMSTSNHPSFEPEDYIDGPGTVNLNELHDLNILDKFLKAFKDSSVASELHHMLYQAAADKYHEMIIYKDNTTVPKIVFDNHEITMYQTKYSTGKTRLKVIITTTYDVLAKVFSTGLAFYKDNMYDIRYPSKHLNGIATKETVDGLVNEYFNED